MDSITEFLERLLNVSSTANGSLTLTQAGAAILVAYVGGILSSLTPCVYPMIPITVSVVGGGVSSNRRAWHEVWVRGLVYVSGMAMVYSFLGVLAGLTGKLFGSMTQTSGWYLFLGIVMTLAALIMIDVIPFDPLVWWETLKRWIRPNPSSNPIHPSSVQKTELSLLGAFTLGASSGFIAAPCTTPVLTSILAYIAKTQSIGLGLTLMLAFSLGLGTLLLMIAGFTGALQILPRSGKWMKAVKMGSGLILLIFAEYLIFRAGKLGSL